RVSAGRHRTLDRAARRRADPVPRSPPRPRHRHARRRRPRRAAARLPLDRRSQTHHRGPRTVRRRAGRGPRGAGGTRERHEIRKTFKEETMTGIALAGLAIWLGATIVLRLWGQYVIDPSAAPAVILLLAISAPLMFYLPRRLFRVLRIERPAFGRAAVLLVAPGMLLDAIATIWFPAIYPNMRPDAARLFGGWLLLCNAMALVGAATDKGTAQRGQSQPN